jgi:hypothetical protein
MQQSKEYKKKGFFAFEERLMRRGFKEKSLMHSCAKMICFFHKKKNGFDACFSQI